MNYNIIGYLLFLAIITFIVIKVGKICYDNGNIFVAGLIPDHKELCQQLNKILLIAYYLVNIGFSATTLIQWKKIISIIQLIEIISIKTAIIITILSILHYLNLFIITNYIQKIIK